MSELATGPAGAPRSRPLRVLQILEATTGGTRRHLYYLLRGLDPARFEVSLIYANQRDPHFAGDLRQFAAWGVRLYEVPMRREIAPGHDLAALVRIMHIIHAGRFDLVHTHSSKAGFLGRLAARLCGVRTIVHTPHSFAFQYCPQSLKGNLYRALERLASRLHHRLICVSQGERQVALDARISPAEKTLVIPNTIDLKDLAPSLASEAIRKRHGIAEGASVVGMVAQFRPQKGHRHFIAAIPLVLARCRKAHFLIVGDGPLLEETRRQVRELGVEERVTFAGHQENPADYYQVMDLFVLSSLWEGMPYVILEAMAMGLAVVATKAAGNAELVEDGQSGFLVAPESSREIAGRVSQLLEDPPLRAGFGQKARHLAQARPDIRKWTECYEKLYLGLCGR